MSEQPARTTATHAAGDRLQQIIDRQIGVMQKQLELLRAVESGASAHITATPADRAPLDLRHPGEVAGGTNGSAPPGSALRPDGFPGLEGGNSTRPSPDRPPEATLEARFESVPLTDGQRDVWSACQLSEEASAAYNLSTALALQGQLDVDALHEALRRLVARHDALRSTIDATGDHMVVHPVVEMTLSLVDLSDRPEPERAARVAAILDAELAVPYDLVAGPLFHFTLVRVGELDHLLILSAHHLVCDGWSFGVMHRDLGMLYSQVAHGDPGPAADATQLREYVAWSADQSQDAKGYWLDVYREPSAQLDLPVDKVRPAIRTFDYGSTRAVLNDELLASLRGLAADQGVTLFIVLLAAWEILLHRLSGQMAFANGVFVSGQASMGTRDLVGLCANLLPMRVRISPDERLSAFLSRLRQDTFDAFDHQHFQLGRLVSALQLPRDPSRPMVVSTVVTMETPTPGVTFSGLRVTEAIHGRRRYGFFDVELYLTETADDIKVDLQYSAGLFGPETIRRWMGHYVHLLQQMVTGGPNPVSALELLDDDERHELLTRWNDTATPVPEAATHQRFEAVVSRDPALIAIRTSGETLTYGELNGRANRLARHLRDLGVERDRLVGIHVDRSPDMLVALLAVHKAGGAYVPLDPMFPAERLAMIASDAGLHVLVTQEELLGTVDVGDVPIVALDRDRSLIEQHEADDLGTSVDPADLAYVIYTSGSTGRPKGVEIAHLSLTNLLESMRVRPGLSADDNLLAVTTMSFDIAGLELFLPLTVGATVVLADQLQTVDALWLRERLGAGDITVMQATPATWQMLLDAGWTGTPGLKALCGGEALSRELATALLGRVGSLWNMYGPTETTIWSSTSEVASSEAPITIGPPIDNTEFHVLDGSLSLQPIGVAGELLIGGAGLARGYRNREDLTRDRFIDVKLDDGPDRRLYRTGDMVRRLPHGEIEYLGRSDFQVKIRGYRIELGEIETVLSRHPDIRECVVVARGGDKGSKRLVAYFIPSGPEPPSVSTLRAYLRETLPDYMVPAIFVALDVFPLTANKKVDRARLPDPAAERPELGTDLVAPRTEAEARLAGIWGDILGVERVGVDDNFFDLGGDSLLALRTIMQANRSGMSLTPISIFRHQTIAELAAEAEAAASSAARDQDAAIGPTPLTPAQLRFLTERRTPDPHHWNLSGLVQVDHLPLDALRVALAALLRHHDALRLRLWKEGDEWQQEVTPPSTEVPVEVHDLSGQSAEERAASIERICSGIQGSFDLGRAPLIKVAYFECGPDQPNRLFVAIHHFAIDGLTWTVFWEDFEDACRQAAEGVAVTLPPRTTPFRSWAIQLDRLAQSPRVVEAAEAWMRLPWDEVSRVPRDLEGGPRNNTNSSATEIKLELSEQETDRLLTGQRRPEHVIIAALGHCLSRWTGSNTVLIDVLSHGRDATLEGVNLARTVGFTLSYNPVVLRHSTWEGTPELLDAVSEQINDLPEGFSFELLRFRARDPDVRTRLTRLPRADLLFNYAGAADPGVDRALFSPAPEPVGPDESPRGIREHPIAVRATLTPSLQLTFVYSAKLHTAETMQARVADVAATIRGLLDVAPVRR